MIGTRGIHAITSAGDAVQMSNKRSWNVLHPRLPAELSRVIAADHVLSTTIARLIVFALRPNCVGITCNTRGYTHKVLVSTELFPRPHRG